MQDLREQIFQATNEFIAAIQQLAQQHTVQVVQETFASPGSSALTSSPRSMGRGATQARGAKRGADELEQLSKRFLQFVHDNPGLRIEQINKELGTSTTELALPIRKLVASGEITVEGQKRSTTYFPGKNSAASASGNGESEDEGKGSGKAAKKRARSKKSRGGARSKSKSKK